jgi:hypothetical protein
MLYQTILVESQIIKQNNSEKAIKVTKAVTPNERIMIYIYYLKYSLAKVS